MPAQLVQYQHVMLVLSSWMDAMCGSYPVPLQNATLFVAAMQFVFGVLRHAASPVYTVQAPPQMLSMRWVQYVTVVANASRDTMPPGALIPGMGSPMKVRSASVVLSQLSISSWVKMLVVTSGCVGALASALE